MATKSITSQSSNKKIRSLSQRSCQVGTIPKREVHGMETRIMAKATTVVIVRQKVTPSPTQQDL